MKVTVVGAGAVGASCAEYIAIKNFASEVVILDIKEGFAEGKAMDLMQTASLNGFDTKITGVTNDYSKTANSDVVVITSGIPRKPGMTREELIGINAGIVKSVSENLLDRWILSKISSLIKYFDCKYNLTAAALFCAKLLLYSAFPGPVCRRLI